MLGQLLFGGQARFGCQATGIDFGADGADNPFNQGVGALKLKHEGWLINQVVRQCLLQRFLVKKPRGRLQLADVGAGALENVLQGFFDFGNVGAF
ncbi:hypothetical protein D3C80_1393050 [compost metagenome]